MSAFDPFGQDPARDAVHPAAMFSLGLESGGERLNGVLYVAAGPGPHPTALLLHGFPGYERNLDVAQALRSAGWNAAVFHYRGAWGSGGSFTFANVPHDAEAVLDALRAPEAPPGWRIDRGLIAVVGHSMGGWAALELAARRPDLLGAGALALWNLGAVADQAALQEGRAAVLGVFRESVSPLRGTNPERLLGEVLARGNRWDLRSLAAHLAGRRLLLVAADRDSEAPVTTHHGPVAEALRRARAAALTERSFETDHAFSDHRVALARTVIEWLGTLL